MAGLRLKVVKSVCAARTWAVGLVASIAAVLELCSAPAGPSIFTAGTMGYEPPKACNSFVLFAAPDGKTDRIDTGAHRLRFHKQAADDGLTSSLNGGSPVLSRRCAKLSRPGASVPIGSLDQVNDFVP